MLPLSLFAAGLQSSVFFFLSDTFAAGRPVSTAGPFDTRERLPPLLLFSFLKRGSSPSFCSRVRISRFLRPSNFSPQDSFLTFHSSNLPFLRPRDGNARFLLRPLPSLLALSLASRRVASGSGGFSRVSPSVLSLQSVVFLFFFFPLSRAES